MFIMRSRFTKKAWLVIIALGLNFGVRLNAAMIYDNSVNDSLFRLNPGTLEVGDEITLTSADASRYLQTFRFEYWGTASSASFAGTVKAEVKFYLNDGPLFNGYMTPGTVLYDSGLFSVPTPTDRNTFVFSAGSDFAAGGLFLGPGPGGTLLTSMTWSVQFSGMGAGDAVGVDIYSPPVVGGNFSDYWVNPGAWALQTNLVPINFAATMSATPEPAPVILWILGGLGLLTAGRRLSRKN
jgi:hypothetical protein